MPSSPLNNPYAEAYLQMNPAVARSYYLEHSGRSNYTLTSEHQKIVCVLIMIALGCYVVGFAIIMIRQVIRDTQHREADACDCVKYNGEHCSNERCPGSGDYLDEITDEVLKEIRLPALSTRKQPQVPIEISVNMDGTYCREYPVARHGVDKLVSSGQECSDADHRVACDKFSSNKYVNEEFLLDDKRCPFSEPSLLSKSHTFGENHRCSEPLFSRDVLNYSNGAAKVPEEHPTGDSNHSASKQAEQTSDKAANQQFSLIKSADQSESAFLPITWQLPCRAACGRSCRSTNCVMPNGHCILAGKLASPTGCAILNGHLSSCSSLNFVSPANCSNSTNVHCSAANSICLLSNRIHCSLPINSSLIEGLSNALPNGLANGPENNTEKGLANGQANDQPNGQQTNGLTGSLTSCSSLMNDPSNGLLTNGPASTDGAAYKHLLNGLANSAVNRLASSMRGRPDSPNNPEIAANGTVSSASSSALVRQPNASTEQAASYIRPTVELVDGLTNNSPIKEELNFKQTEIHTNAEERSRLFNKFRSEQAGEIRRNSMNYVSVTVGLPNLGRNCVH